MYGLVGHILVPSWLKDQVQGWQSSWRVRREVPEIRKLQQEWLTEFKHKLSKSPDGCVCTCVGITAEGLGKEQAEMSEGLGLDGQTAPDDFVSLLFSQTSRQGDC